MFTTKYAAELEKSLNEFDFYQVENVDRNDDKGDDNGPSIEKVIATQCILSALTPALCSIYQQRLLPSGKKMGFDVAADS